MNRCAPMLCTKAKFTFVLCPLQTKKWAGFFYNGSRSSSQPAQVPFPWGTGYEALISTRISTIFQNFKHILVPDSIQHKMYQSFMGLTEQSRQITSDNASCSTNQISDSVSVESLLPGFALHKPQMQSLQQSYTLQKLSILLKCHLIRSGIPTGKLYRHTTAWAHYLNIEASTRHKTSQMTGIIPSPTQKLMSRLITVLPPFIA